MKSLIIAEKPSVGRDIANTLNINENVMATLKIINILSHGH